MTGKPRHGKGKHPSQSKKRRERQRHVAVVQQPVAAQAPRHAAPADMPAPPASAPTPSRVPSAAQHPYIIAELKRIGILSGVMVVILIVLALVLS